MELFGDLPDTEIEQLLERLVAYAIRLIRKSVWRGVRGDAVPGGREAMDIVSEVLLKYEQGDRKLNPRANLEGHLLGGVRSAVDALIRRKENTREIRTDVEVVGPSTGRRNPEQAAIYNECTGMVHDAMLERVIEDDGLMAAWTLFEEQGCYQPGELAEALGLDEKQARALRRRFSRALDAAIRSSLEASDA